MLEELVTFDFNEIYHDNSLNCVNEIHILLNATYDNEVTIFISKWLELKCGRWNSMQQKGGAQSTGEVKDLSVL